MPNTSKTLLVLYKEVSQLLVAGKSQKSQIEPSCESPSLWSPWVRILVLDLECKTGGVYKPLLGPAFMLISEIEHMREEDRMQSSEEDVCKKSIKGNTNTYVSMEVYVSNGVHQM